MVALLTVFLACTVHHYMYIVHTVYMYMYVKYSNHETLRAQYNATQLPRKMAVLSCEREEIVLISEVVLTF